MTHDAKPAHEHTTHPIAAGTLIVKENEVSQKMYVIKKGRARVFKNYLGQRITLAVLGEGEIFGEMGFVDAQPRSASVQALTDMEVIVVDGAKGPDGIESIPPWVWTIFKTVFHRFRQLDSEIISLRTALNYRKKGLKQDVAASTVYLELVRFIKTLRMVYDNRTQSKASLKLPDLFAEMDSLLGNRTIGLRQFWNLMQEYDLFDPAALATTNEVKLECTRLDGFDAYLKDEIGKERYLMLSHGSLSMMRQLMATVDKQANLGDNNDFVVKASALNLNAVANPGAALDELERVQLIPFVERVFRGKIDRLHNLYVYQSIVKTFDHSAMYVD